MNRFGLIAALRKRSLPAQTFTLTACMVVVYATVLCVAARHGIAGIVAASLAAGVCWASALTALWLSRALVGSANGMAGMLLPTFARTAPPLLLAIVVRLLGPGLVEAGFVYYLVGFYLLALAVEMPMSLPRNRTHLRRVPGLAGKDRRVHG